MPYLSIGLAIHWVFAASLYMTSGQIPNQEGSQAATKAIAPGSPITNNIFQKQSAIKLVQNTRPLDFAQGIRQGNQLSFNGQIISVAWSQWQLEDARVRVAISDTGLMQALGVELLNTNNPSQQPVRWFSQTATLSTYLFRGYRYLDITDLVEQFGWQLQVDGQVLRISAPSAQIINIREAQQPQSARIVIDLDRGTPWQISHQPKEQKALLTIPGIANSALIQKFTRTGEPTVGQIDQEQDSPPIVSNSQFPLTVETSQNKTNVSFKIPFGWQPRVWTISNPNRIVIDIAPDAMVERNIAWAPGVRWRQKLINLGTSRFPVTWLEINPRQSGVTLKPILNNPNGLVGITPLAKFAPSLQAIAAVNAGFFNRNVQLPLGAIRQNGQWLSSPILNRGAIAWNDTGEFKFDRIALRETLLIPSGQSFSLMSLNSGYIQPGIARYTTDWGKTYTPLTDNEIIVSIENNQVTTQKPGGIAGKTAFPIPNNGYLLTLRAYPQAATLLSSGTIIQLDSLIFPSEFNNYPHILGAGPLLIKNRQVILDAKSEKFSDAFIREKAIRSAIGITESGILIIAAVHERANGPGPTLIEIAQLMQLMGTVNALNLDGGSSTSLYLGGQLINRSPVTAARIHNGIGIFLPTSP